MSNFAYTDIIYRAWSDMSAKEYKRFKGLTKENIRDNMTNKELVLNMLAELSTKEIFPEQLEATSPTPPPDKQSCKEKNRD